MLPLVVTLAVLTFTLPLPLVLQLLIAAALPLLVGLVTNRVTGSARKAILLLVLSIVSAGLNDLLTSLKADRTFDVGLWLLGAIATFLTSGAFHLVLWKPTGLAAAAQDAIPATQPTDVPKPDFPEDGVQPQRALDADGDGKPDYAS